MKAKYFFDPCRKTGKFFMILFLTFPERMALAKAGGFDQIIGSAGWIEKESLQESLKFPDRSCFIFRDYLERLDYIRDELANKLGKECKIKNILATPTFVELLAKNHLASDVGILNLFIDHNLPLLSQRRRMLWGTYRPNNENDYGKFSRECKSRWPYVKVGLWTLDVLVVRGYYQSGFAWLQRYLNKHEGLSIKTNVLDAESYPMLLLRNSI